MEAKDGGPLVSPGHFSLDAGSKEPLPLLEDFYAIAAQQAKRLNRIGDPPPAVESAFTPYLFAASASLPLLHDVLRSDWNPTLRPVLRFQHCPSFTASEDALLTMAFSPLGLCYSPPTVAVSPDWAKVQARYLPTKTLLEIRKRFANIRWRNKDHPLHHITLKIGTRGHEASLMPSEVHQLEEELQKHKRNGWATAIRNHFPLWDRRALKRSATPHSSISTLRSLDGPAFTLHGACAHLSHLCYWWLMSRTGRTSDSSGMRHPTGGSC